MTLKPDPTDKCLWKPETKRTAGVHAIIIGVSDYPYLADGSAPPADRAPDNGGLRQLEVCAKTAAKIFDWLSTSGEVAGAPLATCRLLLAPRSDERAEVDQLTGGTYGSADFAAVRAAIEAWGDDIMAGGTEADPNVAFFFFSGHGTEYMASPALLCRDILNPKSAVASHKAVAFYSLCQAVKTLGIDRALLFIDACRDVPAVARTLSIVGEDILKPLSYSVKAHEALLCLQSTKTGGSAYQVAGDPATIFGQAVLEGLNGPPPSYQPYDTTDVPWKLVFKNLESYVKQQVRELLKTKAATLIQAVVPYGDPYNGDMLVALKAGPTPSGPRQPRPSVIRAPTPSFESAIAMRSADVLKDFTSFGINELTAAPGRGGELGEFGPMHRVFGHEAITGPWVRTLRILDAGTGQAVPPETVQLFEARSQQFAASQPLSGSLTAWVDVVVRPNGSPVWIGAGGENGTPSFAVMIPRDLQHALPARIDVAFQEDASGWTLAAMSARIGDPAQASAYGVPPVWSALWEIQRRETLSDLGQAGTAARDLAVLEQALDEKMRSPVAAAIASSILLRSGALDQLHDWPRNLANWFTWLPDGALLWAETLLRRDDAARSRNLAARPPELAARPPVGADRAQLRDDVDQVRRLVAEPAYQEARGYFSKLAERGPPLLAASLAMAALQSRFWKRVVEIKAVDGDDYFALKDACEVVERAAAYAVSDGLFAGFAAQRGILAPHELLGARRAAPVRVRDAA